MKKPDFTPDPKKPVAASIQGTVGWKIYVDSKKCLFFPQEMHTIESQSNISIHTSIDIPFQPVGSLIFRVVLQHGFEWFVNTWHPTASKAEVPDFILGDFKLSPGSGRSFSARETIEIKRIMSVFKQQEP